MDELRKIFLAAGVKECDVDRVIETMGLTEINDLAYFTDARSFAEAGVVNMLAQQKLATEAARIKASLEAKPQEDAELTLSMLAEDVDEDQWLNSLSQTGILRFNQSTYIAGIKSVLAANLGVFASVEKLAELINNYSVKNAIPAPNLFYALQDIITRREYGLVFAASENNRVGRVPIYTTSKEMAQLMQKIMSDFVPCILDTASRVVSWYNDLASQKTADFFMEKTMQDAQQSQPMSYPSPAALYDAAANLRISINRTFSGNGMQKALAIYTEYKEFRDILNDTDLPKSVGALDKDTVLNMLGFDVNAAAVRSEKFIVKFVISVLDAERLAAENEVLFFRELYNLVRQIDWSALTGNPNDAQMFLARSTTTGLAMGTNFGTIGIPYSNSEANAIAIESSRAGIQQMNGQPLLEQG